MEWTGNFVLAKYDVSRSPCKNINKKIPLRHLGTGLRKRRDTSAEPEREDAEEQHHAGGRYRSEDDRQTMVTEATGSCTCT